MTMNLFNIFDPSTSMNLSLNLFSPFLSLLLIPYMFWFLPSRLIFSWNLLIKFLFNEFKIFLKFSLSNLLMFISLFMIILVSNFMSLFPYIFASSSHMSFSLSISLIFWISIMTFKLINFISNTLIYLTPSNTPTILLPFMVMIEITSQLIRPLTLSIRLTANITAGHLILSLISYFEMSFNTLVFLSFLMITQIILLILEISMSFIQAYVFSTLSLLYSSET